MKGLPGPPHSYLFGSLISVGKVMVKQPRNAAPQTLLPAIREYYDLPDVYYFDPWPMGPPVMSIGKLELLNDFVVKTSIPKHPLVGEFMENFGGKSNLVSSESAEWKRWRAAFNPGFSNSHMMSQISTIVDECKTFCEIMENHAENNDIFRMERATTKLTVDIIGKIVLDLDLNAQKGPNVLVDCFNSQVQWQEMGAQYQPSELWDIRRPFIQRYNNWRMDRYLRQRIAERFASRESRGKTKHVVDLALEVYLKDVKGTNGNADNVKTLDPEFMKAAIANMKAFIFAGHDTTSSTIGCAFYYLSKNPESLKKLRDELDEVFGLDPTTVADQLVKDPFLINKLDYTMAVCKEVLRLVPPASTVRQAPPE
jgi:cytochrome P450